MSGGEKRVITYKSFKFLNGSIKRATGNSHYFRSKKITEKMNT